MGFLTCNLVILRGGSADERARAAAILPAGDPDEAAGVSTADELRLSFDMDSTTPEDELILLAKQFPGIDFALCYATLDGEFSGWLRAAGETYDCGSEDFGEGTAAEIERRHGGDCRAWAFARYATEIGASTGGGAP